jgi:hypothetical protein
LRPSLFHKIGFKSPRVVDGLRGRLEGHALRVDEFGLVVDRGLLLRRRLLGVAGLGGGVLVGLDVDGGVGAARRRDDDVDVRRLTGVRRLSGVLVN